MKQHPRTAAIYALLFLAILYTLYFAASLLIPVVIAVLFALLLSPLVSFLNRFYVPRAISAALLIVAIGGPFTIVGMELVGPAQKWMKRAPEVTARVNQQLTTISEVLAPATQQAPPEQIEKQPEEKSFFDFFGWFKDEDQPEPVASVRPSEGTTALSEKLAVGGLGLVLDVLGKAPVFLAQCMACVILLVFLLVYGPGAYNTAIAAFPQIRDKSQATQLAVDTQRELSRYILTVSLINAGLGLATALVLWLIQFEDPLLWGAMVGLLNFAPYVGTILSLGILGLAGLAQYGMQWESQLPALAYFLLNSVEAQLITPAVLGRKMRMNPLVIMIWLMIWGWLWGMAGVLIAVPLLVCIKLILARSGLFASWLQLIESRA